MRRCPTPLSLFFSLSLSLSQFPSLVSSSFNPNNPILLLTRQKPHSFTIFFPFLALLCNFTLLSTPPPLLLPPLPPIGSRHTKLQSGLPSLAGWNDGSKRNSCLAQHFREGERAGGGGGGGGGGAKGERKLEIRET